MRHEDLSTLRSGPKAAKAMIMKEEVKEKYKWQAERWNRP
jgi:hypothetical protein